MEFKEKGQQTKYNIYIAEVHLVQHLFLGK